MKPQNNFRIAIKCCYTCKFRDTGKPLLYGLSAMRCYKHEHDMAEGLFVVCDDYETGYDFMSMNS